MVTNAEHYFPRQELRGLKVLPSDGAWIIEVTFELDNSVLEAGITTRLAI